MCCPQRESRTRRQALARRLPDQAGPQLRSSLPHHYSSTPQQWRHLTSTGPCKHMSAFRSMEGSAAMLRAPTIASDTSYRIDPVLDINFCNGRHPKYLSHQLAGQMGLTIWSRICSIKDMWDVKLHQVVMIRKCWTTVHSGRPLHQIDAGTHVA